MGMDVYGENPATNKGEYFRNNVWWWRPLWDYCVEVGDDILPAGAAEKGHFNDCWGIDDKGAKRLARRLRDKLDSGHTKQYATERGEHLKRLPDEPCPICDATGKSGKGPCTGCDGKGQRRPWDTEYPFAEDNVREFAEFLDDSGGFKIC